MPCSPYAQPILPKYESIELMSRLITVGAAQLGPIQRDDDRASVVKRLIELLN